MTETVALYARVSSEEQREQQTIRTQLEYARGRAKLEGWKLREFIDDGVSGKRIPFAKRAGGAALLEGARRGEFSRVVTYRLDRLGRRARYIHEALEDLTTAGVAYASLTEPFDTSTAAGKLFLGILAVMAEFESDSITQRTADGRKRVATLDDRWVGGPVPYGYDLADDGRLRTDVSEAQVVRRIFDWTITEGWGCTRVADGLNAAGIAYSSTGPRAAKRHKRRAAAWHPVAVNRILRNEMYAGRASYFRSSKTTEVLFRQVPAIVTPTQFTAARRAIGEHRQWNGSHATRSYLLRGLIVCGRDGHNLIGRQWRSRGSAYYCDECPKGNRPLVTESQVLDVLWADVLDFLEHPDQTLRAMAHSATETGTTEQRAERDLLDLDRRIRELEAQEEQLVEMRLSKQITPAVLDRKAKAIQEERARIETRKAEARSARAKAVRKAEETDSVRKLLKDLRGIAEAKGKDLAERAAIVRTVAKAVVVHTAAGRSRIDVTYGFSQPKVGLRVAAAQTPSGSSRGYTPEMTREHTLTAV